MNKNKQSILKIRSVADTSPMPTVKWSMPEKYGANEPDPRSKKASKPGKKK